MYNKTINKIINKNDNTIGGQRFGPKYNYKGPNTEGRHQFITQTSDKTETFEPSPQSHGNALFVNRFEFTFCI